MNIACPRCGVELEYKSKPPSFCSECGNALHPTPQAETLEYHPNERRSTARPVSTPEFVGDFRIIRPLGAGGMGFVYEAESKTTGRRVALKLLSAAYTESEDAVERFRREGKLASSLSHSRCVFVLTAEEEAGRPYIVMELMPGKTLETLVEERGPLPPEEAIAKILDVIEGLQQAHKLGIVHRDVKPSNCFLEEDGRVKVGDFGLSKSLVQTHHLTKTGSFLGTPLFASPEQIKAEVVDAQSDVYSVAATLYYLVTGKAPFQADDAAATLARIVSETPVSPRKLRPGLDPLLATTILRGLERNRARRWKDLSEFKNALQRCRPDQLSTGGLGLRFAAYLIDYVLFTVVNVIVFVFINASLRQSADARPGNPTGWELLGVLIPFLYFGLSESIWGRSLGKFTLRLQVCRMGGSSPPELLRGFWRAAVFQFFANLATFVFLTIWLMSARDLDFAEMFRQNPVGWLAVIFVPLFTFVLGYGLLLAPMRRRNGFRGLHEWLSGTHVTLLPEKEKRLDFQIAQREFSLADGRDSPSEIGPYSIEGAIRWTDDVKVVRGQDNILGREVWVWLRPENTAPLDDARRDVSRAGRLRWLNAGREGGWRWDAFAAISGRPFAEFIREHGRLAWSETQLLIEQLAKELNEAKLDGTQPPALSVEQLWLQPDGTIQLLDFSLSNVTIDPLPKNPVAEPPDAELLRLTTVLCLEGQPRVENPQAPIRAPLPGHVWPILVRLIGWQPPYQSAGELHKDLIGIADKPAAVSRNRRMAHLAILAAFLFVGLCGCMFPFSFVFNAGQAQMSFIFLFQAQRVHDDLKSATEQEIALSALDPNMQFQIRAATSYLPDLVRCEMLQEQIAAQRKRYQAMLQSGSVFTKLQLQQMEKNMTSAFKQQQQRSGKKPNIKSLRRDASGVLKFPTVLRFVYLIILWPALGIVLWPLIWVIWAFATRGGFSYRLAGITIVQGDGKPAARWRCALRAFLVWFPLAALLAASAWLQVQYWMTWQPENSYRWMYILADALWYIAALLAIAWIGIALWRPDRSLHDKLAGTYLTPK